MVSRGHNIWTHCCPFSLPAVQDSPSAGLRPPSRTCPNPLFLPPSPSADDGTGRRFVVATRLTGIPWTDEEITLIMQDKLLLASKVGHALAQVHSLPLPRSRSQDMEAAFIPSHVASSKPACADSCSLPYASGPQPQTVSVLDTQPVDNASTLLNAHTEGSPGGVAPIPPSMAASVLPSHGTHEAPCHTVCPGPACSKACQPLSLSPSTEFQQQQQQRHGLDPAWGPLLEQLSQKLEVLERQMADPEGPDGLAGIFPAHLWRELPQHLPAFASQLLSLPAADDLPLTVNQVGNHSRGAQPLCMPTEAKSSDLCGPVWLHNDLSCANILLHRDGAAVTDVELLDFGDAAPGHPLMDFVVLHVRSFRCPSSSTPGPNMLTFQLYLGLTCFMQCTISCASVERAKTCCSLMEVIII